MSRSMTTYLAPVSGGYASAYLQYQSFGQMSKAFNGALTRTTDTGQVNFQTAGVVSGYEMFGMADTLQATKPIYLRLSYAIGTSTLTAQIGTVTSGTGNLSGVTTGTTTGINLMPSAQSTNTGVIRYAYASSGDGSQMCLFNNVQATGSAGVTADGLCGLIVERTRDADGTPNGNGFMLYRWQSTGDTLPLGSNPLVAVNSYIYDVNATQPAGGLELGGYVPQLANATAYIPNAQAAGQTFAYPVYGYAGAVPQGASKALMLCYTSDTPRMAPVTVSHYGTNMQFMTMGGGPSSYGTQVHTAYQSTTAVSSSRASLVSPAFRWE